ncbi:hypothetical protein JZ751_030055 [Albula glossodonta]|uniref:Uncharacterized protein n=1 Tax=Albula glossodonta TaxID=121402 RepID=A0A8T2MR66_9TELE|nr:hypothetical protein JZ751_030055 [Albula glossodonta]
MRGRGYEEAVLVTGGSQLKMRGRRSNGQPVKPPVNASLLQNWGRELCAVGGGSSVLKGRSVFLRAASLAIIRVVFAGGQDPLRPADVLEGHAHRPSAAVGMASVAVLCFHVPPRPALCAYSRELPGNSSLAVYAAPHDLAWKLESKDARSLHVCQASTRHFQNVVFDPTDRRLLSLSHV